jgi:Zn-dependent protease with chaperone function
MKQDADTDTFELNPLPYRQAIRDFLKSEEPEVWKWYASQKVREEQAEAVRFDLLKATYRIERDSHPELYATAEDVARRLSLEIPVTIYQAQNPRGLNASLAYLPNEGHVVLHGPVTTSLTDPEFRALLAHELSHLLLWQGWQGEFLVVDQILAALTHDRRADNAHFASARLFQLYNEIFCDRGALLVAQDPLVVISMLVKVDTGVDHVDAASYLRQADEIFAKQRGRSDGKTHPESFIRARALQIWHAGGDDVAARIAEMIEGPLAFEDLDLLAQKTVSALTRRLLERLLAPKWMQTDLTLGHARLFFDDFSACTDGKCDSALPADLQTIDKPLVDYYCYVLLDFASVDAELEELPLAAALAMAEELGIKPRFLEIAKKELKLRKSQWDRIDREKHDLIAKAESEQRAP